MANGDRPRGFWPVGRVKQSEAVTSGAACYPGDFVRKDATGRWVPVAAGESIEGLCLSYAAAAGTKILCSTDPSQQYAGQASGAEINAQTDVGNAVDILATAGDATYKTSRQEIDSTTLAAGTAAQLIVREVEERADNAFGANVEVRVTINEHQQYGVNGAVGV